MHIMIPVSVGEAIDKVSILKIKLEKGLDVLDEYTELKHTIDSFLDPTKDAYFPVCGYWGELSKVNLRLWDLENDIRSTLDIGARKKACDILECIHELNAERAKLKRQINDKYQSDFQEVKKYERGYCSNEG